MAKSKPTIIIAVIIGALIGGWITRNGFDAQRDTAVLLALVMPLALGIGIYNLIVNAQRRNRKVDLRSDAERRYLLADRPSSGARVLIYREGFIAKMSGFDIAIDGVLRAQLQSPQAVAIDLPPGGHVLMVGVPHRKPQSFSFTLAFGEIAVIRIAMRTAITGCQIASQPLNEALPSLRTYRWCSRLRWLEVRTATDVWEACCQNSGPFGTNSAKSPKRSTAISRLGSSPGRVCDRVGLSPDLGSLLRFLEEGTAGPALC
ncbi:hypothetical protein [Sphingomonas sp.]|uniref:hypothetical protein n=1 Tax=Sphingomonas sp. TaxID=28214 RepID=UPI003B3A1DF1